LTTVKVKGKILRLALNFCSVQAEVDRASILTKKIEIIVSLEKTKERMRRENLSLVHLNI
jgi:hypothetical protein